MRKVSIIFLLSVLLLFIGCTKVTDIKVNVYTSRFAVTIENRDQYDWKNVEIRINKDFIYKTKKITRGETEIALIKFINKNGRKFNPVTYKVEDININALTPSGKLVSSNWRL